MNLGSIVNSSEKLDLRGLDWQRAADVGLTDDERTILTYFADIEAQTLIYLRDFLGTRAAFEPDVASFVTLWNYEEYFHGEALARLLAVTGRPLDERRLARVRVGARVTERVEAALARGLSWAFPDDFPAIYMTWGAVQELTTLRGYERIAATTRNPVLAEICRRIAKQERRHFAWYFNSARTRLARSATARTITRRALAWFWTPVGAGVKSPAEVRRLMEVLFPGEVLARVARDVDEKIHSLPGLDGVPLFARYAGRSLLAAAQPAEGHVRRLA
jgi:rubrerythrin